MDDGVAGRMERYEATGNGQVSIVTAAASEGARGTGTQQFKLDSGGVIYGNADSGFTVEVKN